MFSVRAFIAVDTEENGTVGFDFHHKITVEKSIDQLTQTAAFVVPKKLVFQGKDVSIGQSSIFKRGNAVRIYLGYYPECPKVFEGFISDIKGDLNTTIFCEDLMWKLKQEEIQFSYKGVQLSQLIKDTIPSGFEYEVNADTTIGHIRSKSKVAFTQLLETLRKDYSVHSFIREGVLHLGQRYPDTVRTNVDGSGVDRVFQFAFHRNVLREGNTLVYKREDDVDIKLTLRSTNYREDSGVEVEVGDVGGSNRTLYFFDQTAKELKEIGEREIKKIRFTGYRGKFKTFALPKVEVGDLARLVDAENPKQIGAYIIKSVF